MAGVSDHPFAYDSFVSLLYARTKRAPAPLSLDVGVEWLSPIQEIEQGTQAAKQSSEYLIGVRMKFSHVPSPLRGPLRGPLHGPRPSVAISRCK